jgi:hypothetical protein
VDAVKRDRLEDLVDGTLGGSVDAWQALWLAVEPLLWDLTARFRLTSRLCRSEEDRRNIVLGVMERLHADDFRRLRRFRASLDESGDRRGGGFEPWLATMAARAAVSYLRAHPEYARGADHGRSRWVELEPMPTDLEDARADPARDVAASSLLAEARRILRQDQLEALLLWLSGRDHAEMAQGLGLDGEAAADRLVRSALKRLRNRSAPRDAHS